MGYLLSLGCSPCRPGRGEHLLLLNLQGAERLLQPVYRHYLSGLINPFERLECTLLPQRVNACSGVS